VNPSLALLYHKAIWIVQLRRNESYGKASKYLSETLPIQNYLKQ